MKSKLRTAVVPVSGAVLRMQSLTEDVLRAIITLRGKPILYCARAQGTPQVG